MVDTRTLQCKRYMHFVQACIHIQQDKRIEDSLVPLYNCLKMEGEYCIRIVDN